MNGNGNSLNNEEWYQQPQAYCFHQLLKRQADRNPEAIVMLTPVALLELINVLSQRLREANNQVADLLAPDRVNCTSYLISLIESRRHAYTAKV